MVCNALEETVATTSQPAQRTRCKNLQEEQPERRNIAALKCIERQPKYKKKSGEPDEFDGEQTDEVAGGYTSGSLASGDCACVEG